VKGGALLRHQRDPVEAHSAGDVDDFGDRLELQTLLSAHEYDVVRMVAEQGDQAAGRVPG